MEQPQYLGNTSLLERKKIAFLCSSNISSLSVLPTLDWAAEVAMREDVSIVSGFHSKMERQVLDFLLRGRCGIIYVMARGIYKKPIPLFQTAFTANRILFISNEKPYLTRSSKDTCHRRNEYVAQISDELVFSSVSPTSSLYPFMQIQKPIKQF